MNTSLIQDNKQIKYAIVEVVLERGSTRHIERGLFSGLKFMQGHGVASPSTFVWLNDGTSNKKMCSLDSYTVISIEIYDGATRTMVFFMSDEDEQEEAKALLEAIKESLGGMTTEDPDIIDTELYENVPEEFGGKGTKQSSTPYQQRRESEFNRQAAGSGVYSRTYVRKEPEPTAFKRKSRKPSKILLQKLITKLDLIAKGEYECSLPKVKGEQEEDKEEAKTGTDQGIPISGAAADPWKDGYDC